MTPDQLIKKTATHFPEFSEATLLPIYGGGSDRQFYHLTTKKDHPLILVHYSKEKTENKHYAAHAQFLKSQSVHVPEVMAHDTEERLLWLQDLGEKSLWTQRNESWKVRSSLYELALVQAARLHRIPLTATTEEGLTLQAPFDTRLYRWEQNYFLKHALGGLFGIEESTRKRLASTEILHHLASNLATLPRQLIHRDFQSQNVILFQEKAWLIDFQGMRAGLAPYDLASLLCDPYVTITATEREYLLKFYQQEMKSHGVLLPDDFEKIFWQCAVQRLMQALGAYGFLSLQKGKTAFRQYVTPTMTRLREALEQLHQEDELQELLEVLRKCENPSKLIQPT